ncbi:MAG: iron-containing alcohol dehydrogenase [Alphaproteobacteria bacterium]
MATLQYLTTTHFDFGALEKLKPTLGQLGVSRPMIATDAGLVSTGIVDTVRGAMEGLEVTVFDGTPENPTEEAVREAAQLYRDAGCDGIVALGGGSPMDLGKGVALAVTHEGPLAQYAAMEGGKVGPVAPLVAVPTTAGTGSEVSVGAVIICEDGRKLTFAGPSLIPKVAICDPELTLGLPPRLTAATGMDAMTHCIEALLSPIVNPPAEAIALDGIERGLGRGHLERAVADGSDRDARWNMMMASTEGALSFIKGLGAVHAMSHAAGRLKELRLHHGTLNAVCLPHVLRYNADHVGGKFGRIRKAAGLAPDTDLADYIAELNARIGLPGSLGEMGVTRDMMPGLVENAVGDLANLTNPRKCGPEDYETLFDRAIG